MRAQLWEDEELDLDLEVATLGIVRFAIDDGALVVEGLPIPCVAAGPADRAPV